MGFRFRHSFKIVPGVRLNLSGSGASVSLGPRGAHFTIGPHGTRTTVGLPGSGISWTAYQPHPSDNRSSPPTLPNPGKAEATNLDRSATVIDSAPIEQLVASSTIDIADAMNASRSRWQLYKTLLVVLSVGSLVGAFLVVGSTAAISPAAAFMVAAGAVIILGAIMVHGRETSTVSLDYDLSGEGSQRFEALRDAFGALASCSRVWSVPLEKQQADWKRNAGASKTIERTQISPTIANPLLVKSNVEFLQLPLGKETLYFTPDAILVIAGAKVAAFRYSDVEIVSRPTRFIEDGVAPTDTQVVGETWRFLNRNGGPDRRFNNNRKLPICLYGEIDLKSPSGLNERIHCSSVDISQQFASAATAMRAIDYVAASTASDNPPVVPLTFAPQQNRDSDTTEVSEAYSHETEAARTLAMNHGRFWEFLLVQELLKSKLQALKTECDGLANIVPRKHLTGREFFHWIGSECSELSSAITSMSTCIDNDLKKALGEPGISGNAIEILRAVNSLFRDCRRFLKFEADLNAAEVPSVFYGLKDSFRGITVSMVSLIEDLYAQWSRSTDGLRSGAQKFEFKVTFEGLPQLTPALEAFERIKKRPELY